MEFLIGVVLAGLVCAFAMLAGFDSESRLLSDGAGHGSTPALLEESLVAGAFLAAAVTGFKKSLWLIVAV